MSDQPAEDGLEEIVDRILTGLDNITDYANKSTFTDSRLLVLASLLQTQATLVVAARLREIWQLQYELKL